MRDLCKFTGDLIKGPPGTVWKRPCSQGVRGGEVERATDCETCDKYVKGPPVRTVPLPVVMTVEFESEEEPCRWGLDLLTSEAMALDLNPLRHWKKCCNKDLPLKTEIVCPDRGCGAGCDGYQVEPRAATEVVFNMGAGGLGDGVQGLLAVGAYARDHPEVTVVYRVGKPALPFVTLFEGYDELREHEWDVNASRTLSGPDVQMNNGFWAAEVPDGPTRIDRYLKAAGAERPEPVRLRERERLTELGRAWAGFVALCPFSAGSDREYSVQGWVTLERALKSAGYRTVVVHKNSERNDPLASPKLVDRPAEEVVGCLLNAACVIGCDSGLAHLAAALGRPTLALMGQTRGGQVFAGYDLVRWLEGPLSCSGCYHAGPWEKRYCRPLCPSLQGISPDQIVKAVKEMTGPSSAEVRTALKNLERAAADDPTPYPGGSGRGVVTAGEGTFWPMTVAMIHSLRETGCRLPVEVWFRGEAGAVRPEDVAGLGVTLIDADARARRFGDNLIPRGRPDSGGWENKLYAMTHTRFETVVWLDADLTVLKDPAFMADLADAHGFVTWTDSSAEAAQHLKWPEVWPAGPGGVPGVTSGQIALNRRLAWRQLALAHWICQRSPFYFPRMLGDQDAWRVAFAATGGRFRDLGGLVKVSGVKHLFRFDHEGEPVFLHRSGPKLLPVPGFAEADARHVARFAEAVAPIDDGAVLTALARDTLLDAVRLRVLRDSVVATNHLPGALAEFGVYRGGAARLMSALAPGAELHLFDTFAGMPEDDQDGEHRRGEFATALDEVRANVANPAAVYHVGRFPDALPPEGTRFRLVHIDCDLYQSVRAGLEYFCPRMVPGGIMLIDDYGGEMTPGVGRAVHEAGLSVEVLAAPQAVARF